MLEKPLKWGFDTQWVMLFRLVKLFVGVQLILTSWNVLTFRFGSCVLKTPQMHASLEICFSPWRLKFSADLLWEHSSLTAVFRSWAAGIASGDLELLTTRVEGELIKFGSFMEYFYFVIKAQSFSIAWAGQCWVSTCGDCAGADTSSISKDVAMLSGKQPNHHVQAPEIAWNAAGKCRSPEGTGKAGRRKSDREATGNA